MTPDPTHGSTGPSGRTRNAGGSAVSSPVGFPPARALEDAAFQRGLRPRSVHRLLLPVWDVEIRSEVRHAEDFQLIDGFLGRALAHTGLTGTGELAAFFGLDTALVAQALAFLQRIGHIEPDGSGGPGESGRWRLTGLGRESVRDGRRYTHTVDDHRRLYLSALDGHPLTRPHYDRAQVTFVYPAELTHPRYRDFHSFLGTTGATLDGVHALPPADRDRYNLPLALIDPTLCDATQVFLPALAVVGGRQAAEETLVYTAAGAGREPDPALSALCGTDARIRDGLRLSDEDRRERLRRTEHAARRWADAHGLDARHVTGTDASDHRVLVPPGAVTGGTGDRGGIALNRLGTYVVEQDVFFLLWCEDRATRCRAAITRLDQRLNARARTPDAADLHELLAPLRTALRLTDASPAELAGIARRAGLTGTAAVLTAAEPSSGPPARPQTHRRR